MHDVIVIGAGPGGATVSRYLASLGLEVLMIDKDSFPRDKPCGGGFSQTIIDDFSYLKSRARDFLKGIARVGVIHSPNRRITLENIQEYIEQEEETISDSKQPSAKRMKSGR